MTSKCRPLKVLYIQLLTFLLCFLASANSSAEKVGIFSGWSDSTVGSFRKHYDVKANCESLRAWTNDTAQVLVAKSFTGDGDLPVYCDVFGHIQTNIKFRMFIPEKWNGRFFMTGNGGLAGDDLLNPSYPQHLRKMKAALRRGFATVMTDSGHSDKEQPGGSFAYNNFSGEMDFAFRAIHVVSETAKTLIRYAYKRSPDYSYFEGCSGGGRQALMSVQRYPDDFDGVVAGAPAFNHTALSVARMIFNPVLNEAGITIAQVKTLGEIVKASCDAGDGATDGLIENPLACDIDFNKQLPRCERVDDKGKCFTARQVAAIEMMHSDVHVQGKRLQPGFPPGSDLTLANGWLAWLPTPDNTQFDFGRFYSEELLRYIAFDKDDPDRSLAQFDAERDVQKFGLAMRMIDATSTDTQSFRQAGSKLLMYMGWQDLAFSPTATVEYYETLVKQGSDTSEDYVRLFMAPGMYHCFGGSGPSNFDYMTPLVTWVEKGVAPEKIIAHQYQGDREVRTHPLCPWPKVARYQGTGPLEEAASFQCVTPE